MGWVKGWDGWGGVEWDKVWYGWVGWGGVRIFVVCSMAMIMLFVFLAIFPFVCVHLDSCFDLFSYSFFVASVNPCSTGR